MIEYFEQLSQEEQEEITEVIQILYRQTFVLERKFDKRQGRMVPVREYRVLSLSLIHIEMCIRDRYPPVRLSDCK